LEVCVIHDYFAVKSGEPKSLLVIHIETIGTHQENEMKYPTCNFPLLNAQSVSNLISDKIAKRKPFSMIRLGDGEGLMLSVSNQSPKADLKYLETHFGPRGMDIEYLLNIKHRLVRSIRDADIIGIRDDIVDVKFNSGNFSLNSAVFLRKFRKNFKLREIELLLKHHAARRIALLHSNLSELNLRQKIQFCSAWCHYDLHTSGEIFRILKQQKQIGLISCRKKLPGLLAELFDLSVKYYEIPDMFHSLPRNKRSHDYIDLLEKVLQQQLIIRPGMLYLVGGGLYGKLYCQSIKSQGGVALDLGSLFDSWLGIPSRPAVYHSMFGGVVNESGVPPQLLLTTENIRSVSRTMSD